MSNFCKLCNKPINEIDLLEVKESMFGTNKKFTYGECHSCGAISLQDNIKDFSEYYDKKDYYSMTNIKKGLFYNIKKIYWNILYRPGVFSNVILGILMIFYKVLSKEVYESIKIEEKRIQFYEKNGIFKSKHSNILDIGCGEGHWLSKLESLGFKELTGLDPHIEKTRKISNNIELIKGDTDGFSRENFFDIVHLSHSLEHMYDHDKIIKNISKFIKKDGVIVISIPIKNQAYKIYKESWFQIDAPRHIIIHTVDSFKNLVEQNGLRVIDYIFDSGAKQFFISEFYKKGVSMYDGSIRGLKKYNFSYNMKIAELYNEKLLGDQAIFLLKRTIKNK